MSWINTLQDRPNECILSSSRSYGLANTKQRLEDYTFDGVVSMTGKAGIRVSTVNGVHSCGKRQVNTYW